MADIKNLLLQAQHEIIDLRRRNEVLQAKVDTMDLFALVLNTSPAHGSVGMAEDVAWALQREIDNIEKLNTLDPKPARPAGSDS
jgi:hypothetical protein